MLILIGGFSACKLNNVEQDTAPATYFEQNNLEGTFALLDNTHEQFTVYNLKRYRDSTFAPGGTFEVLSAMLAIETGRVNDQNSLIKVAGDSTKSISLADAFKLSNHPAFNEVATMIGKDTMQYWLDSLHYGKAKIKSDQERFWSNDSLKITPDEQLGFIAKVYFVSLPFQKRTQEIVRKLMIKENNTLYTLAYKTSWNQSPSGKYNGWITGWVEENLHIYFFVINADPINGQPTEGSLVKTAKAVLAHYGFFRGKK
ncbi:MAG TPA: penicillin-binding transpeptidase domain-containing protein [Arachidicoccus sp.]|nr:penicillin-binding transpeptidase domain-containing protein [Arachidicoccus sp.]